MARFCLRGLRSVCSTGASGARRVPGTGVPGPAAGTGLSGAELPGRGPPGRALSERGLPGTGTGPTGAAARRARAGMAAGGGAERAATGIPGCPARVGGRRAWAAGRRAARPWSGRTRPVPDGAAVAWPVRSRLDGCRTGTPAGAGRVRPGAAVAAGSARTQPAQPRAAGPRAAGPRASRARAGASRLRARSIRFRTAGRWPVRTWTRT